jgi:hypothetical protein
MIRNIVTKIMILSAALNRYSSPKHPWVNAGPAALEELAAELVGIISPNARVISP